MNEPTMDVTLKEKVSKSRVFLQTCNVVPTDQGLEVTTTTQWTQSVQQAVSAICGIKKHKLVRKCLWDTLPSLRHKTYFSFGVGLKIRLTDKCDTLDFGCWICEYRG